MQFSRSNIEGVVVIDAEIHLDDRGSFSRIFCAREFAAHRLPTTFVQSSISFNRRQHTLRGMHFQNSSRAEDKLIRCTRGTIYDVVVDLREHSKTRLSWTSVELSAANQRSVFVPKGCAHGFLTLSDDSEVLYNMTEFYDPSAATGIRWNDPAIAISWPATPALIAERDSSYPDWIA